MSTLLGSRQGRDQQAYIPSLELALLIHGLAESGLFAPCPVIHRIMKDALSLDYVYACYKITQQIQRFMPMLKIVTT